MSDADKLLDGWANANVADLSTYVRGVTYSKVHAKKSAGPGLVAVLRANNIGNGLSFDDLVFVPDRFVSEQQIVRDGDVVLAMSSGSKSVVGKAAKASKPIRCGFGAFCGVIRPSSHMNHELFGYYFQTKTYRNAVSDASKGVNINNLKAEHILDRPFLLPPRAEQDRVANKLDELFSRIEEGERALERVQKLVERYRQSVLKAAVTGELTRAWREQHKDKLESGEALLQRILNARRAAWEKAELDKMKAKGQKPANDQWKQKYQEPSPPDTVGLPELPEGWTWTSVEQLCFVDTGATPKRGTAKYFDGGTIPWVTSGAVNERVISSASELITPEAIADTNAKVFPTGSLIVAMYGEGKTRGKVSELGIDAATNQACATLICGHLPLAVKNYLRSFFEKNYLALRAQAAGGVQPNLNLSILKSTILPFPSSASEVDEINDRLSERQSQLDAVIAQFASWSKQSAALRQTILREAFGGTLVAQDPTDEPASTLLQRIASERGAINSAPKRGRKKMSR